MTPTELLSDLRLGNTVKIPVADLSNFLNAAEPLEVLQIITLVMKGMAYLQIYKEPKPQFYQNN